MGWARIGRAALPVLGALALEACTMEVREQDLLQPVSGGTLAAESLRGPAARYTLSRHDIPAAGGATLHAVLLRQPGARATLLYFGGNGYTIGRFGAWSASVFAPLGVDLMLVDHRGYGLSTGTPTGAALEADGLAAFDHLARQGPLPIVLHGQSLGSFIAGHVAARRPAAGVVLESSVSTADEWVRARTGGAMGAVVKVRVDEALKGRGNLANMASIEEPLLLLVGAKDKVTPLPLSQALYAASPLPPDRKTLAVIRGAGHNDVLLKAEALEAYRRFLEKVSAP